MGKRKGKKKGAKEEDGNVNADDIPAEWRDMVQRLQEIVYRPEQDIYSILVECNMKEEFAVLRLLSKGPSQEVESNQGNEKGTASHSSSQEVGSSSIQNPELSNGCDQGGGNNSDETSNVQGTSNHLADSSTATTTSGILGPYNSDITNAGMPVSSNEAVPLLSEPSSSDVIKNVETKRVPISPGKAVPVWRRPPPSRLISSERTMAEVVKSALSKESVNEAPVKDDPPLHENPDVTDPLANSITEPDATRDQLQESEPVATSLQQLSIENDEPVNEEEPQNTDYGLCTQEELDTHIADEQETPVIQSSADQQNRENRMRQIYNTLNIPYPDFPLNQPRSTGRSITTASSSLGPHRPSISMSEALDRATDFEPRRNQQDMNHYYPQLNVPSGGYGNVIVNSPYSPQDQSNTPTPSAFQHHGGSNNNNTYHHQSQASMRPPQYRNSRFPYDSPHASDYGFATSRDDAANSRFNRSNYRLPSIQHQDQNSNGWLFAQGNGIYSLDPPHWIRQSPSLSHSQQQQQEQEQQPSRGLDYSFMDQQNSRRDPSDRT